jgi:hypothetical protein
LQQYRPEADSCTAAKSRRFDRGNSTIERHDAGG